MTTLVVGENTYIDLAGADAYFDDSLKFASWDALTDDVKSKALVTATRMLDRQTWAGTKTDESQDLQWPRSGVTDKYGNAIDSSTVPQQILEAQCELALSIALDPSVETNSSTSGNIKFLKAGEAEIGYFTPTRGGRFPTIIQELVGQFMGAAASAANSGGAYVSGTCERSHFCSDQYGLISGIT